MQTQRIAANLPATANGAGDDNGRFAIFTYVPCNPVKAKNVLLPQLTSLQDIFPAFLVACPSLATPDEIHDPTAGRCQGLDSRLLDYV